MKHVTGYTDTERFRSLEDLQRDSADLCLVYCGWEYCDPGYRYGPNKRTSYVLHIVRSGKGTLEINDQKYELGEGDAFLIGPEIEAWYEADRQDPWSYMWIGFTGYRAQEYAEHAGFSAQVPFREVKCGKKLNQYIDGMLEAHQVCYEDELKRNGYLMLFFAALMEDYNRMEPKMESQHNYPGKVYVKHAMEYIACHYREKIKINELAAYIGVNRSYLTSSFKKTIGCSPQEYLIDLRMEKAKDMLRNTTMQINAVAAAVGYTDQLAFSKIFKQRCKVSPRDYRAQKEKVEYHEKKGVFHGRS